MHNELRINEFFDFNPLEASILDLMRPWTFGALDPSPLIRLDVTENDKGYAIKADIPGVAKEDIVVRVEGNQVTISAEVKQSSDTEVAGRLLRSERKHGFASRSFALAQAVDDANARAKYHDGVLELELPKRASEAQTRLAIA